MTILDVVDHRAGVVSSMPPPLLEYPFFPVATHKFIVLSYCSLGLYQVYWLYQNWKRLKRASGENLSPVWRVVFAPIWNFFLFRDIGEAATEAGVPFGWSWHATALAWLLLTGMAQLPDPWWLVSMGSILAIVPVQRTAQQVNARYTHGITESRNHSYGLVNVLWIVVGGFVLIMGTIGTFLPE